MTLLSDDHTAACLAESFLTESFLREKVIILRKKQHVLCARLFPPSHICTVETSCIVTLKSYFVLVSLMATAREFFDGESLS